MPEKASADQFSGENPTAATPRRAAARRRSSTRDARARWTCGPTTGNRPTAASGRLVGRKAVITGGDSGIGRAVALAFAREGADVLISYLPEEEKDGQETVRLVEEAGRVAVAVPGDLVEEAACRAVVQRAVEAFGRIDVLVSNAAHQMSAPGRRGGHRHRAARPGGQDQPLRAVLAVQGGAPHIPPAAASSPRSRYRR